MDLNNVKKGSNAWTPVENSYSHFLIINLGNRKLIKKIATAGRANSKEYVTEYIVQYSDNADVWQSYITPGGDEQVYEFKLLPVGDLCFFFSNSQLL